MFETFVDARGVLLRRDLIAAGVDDRILTQAKKDDKLESIRWGAYCSTPVWEAADRAERHRIHSHAVRRMYGDDVARSHVSAHLELGGPDWGLDLSKVHLTSMYGIGERSQANIAHHRGLVTVNDVTRHDDAWLTAPARTALDTAALAARDPAVCVLDWAQQQGHVTREELEQGVERMKEWPNTLGLAYKLRLSNGQSESVLETRSDLFFRDQRLPRPVPQYEICHPSGTLAGRVDFAWPELKAMCECDGMSKYLRLRRPGETIEQCIMREKQREDLLRRLTGWTMIRLIWADLDRPAATARMIREALMLAAA